MVLSGDDQQIERVSLGRRLCFSRVGVVPILQHAGTQFGLEADHRPFTPLSFTVNDGARTTFEGDSP
jgi:hypothetical protein